MFMYKKTNERTVGAESALPGQLAGTCRTMLAFCSALLLANPANAAAPPEFMPGGIEYDAAVTTPAEALGHELGRQPARYDAILAYFRQLAGTSDRIEIETLGRSIEGREIVMLQVTSPRNHARMDEIREAHLAAAAAGDDAALDDDAPAVVWLGFGVHGAEAAGLEAAVPLAHHLAAGRGEAIEAVLDRTVVLIAAALNPDGHARRINHSLKFLSETVVRNGDHAGHELWTRQRANHYGFDLNRQWLLLAQHEPRVWVPAWHRWKPHVTADYHEMGTTSVRPSTYFFSPGDALRDSRLIPEFKRELHQRIARYHRHALDERGTLYFTEEVYNSFYPGSGSAYPNLNGGIGALFEVGTAHLIELDTPLGRWSLAENIAVHFESALTVIAASADLRGELHDYRARFHADTRRLAEADARGGFVFDSPDRSRLARFVDVLNTHGIEVHRLARDVTTESGTFSAESALFVPLAQDAYRVIRTIFDRVTEFEQPNFADVTGWNLALAYNLDHAALTRRQAAPAVIGPPASGIRPDPAPPGRAEYGYVFGWQDRYAPRALYRLLDQGMIARAANRSIQVQTQSGPVRLEPGAIFVPLKGQSAPAETIHARILEIVAESGIEVHAVDTGKSLEQGADFGSGRAFGTLERPEVLLLFDDGVQRFDMGHVWHLLDVDGGMPVVLKQKSRIGEIDWSRFTHIILPGGRGVGLGEAATARARQWVEEEGGTFIAIRQGAEWAQQALLGRPPASDRTLALQPDEMRLDYARLALRQARDVVSGAIFASDLDLTHPLAAGFHRRFLPSHRDTSIVLVRPENPVAVVAEYQQDPLLSGYASERRRAEIGGTPMLIAERMGNGTVVLMADNPDFRGTWPGTSKLLFNSLFFSHLFSSPRPPGGARFRP